MVEPIDNNGNNNSSQENNNHSVSYNGRKIEQVNGGYLVPVLKVIGKFLFTTVATWAVCKGLDKATEPSKKKEEEEPKEKKPYRRPEGMI